MKKLAIVGANEAITILINKAKKLGYETHVFAWQCGDPGEAAADFFYPISIDTAHSRSSPSPAPPDGRSQPSSQEDHEEVLL